MTEPYHPTVEELQAMDKDQLVEIIIVLTETAPERKARLARRDHAIAKADSILKDLEARRKNFMTKYN